MPSPIKKAWQSLVDFGIPLDMLLSIVVVLVWICVMAVATGELGETLIGSSMALLPLALIWFRDPISEIVGSFGFHQINAESPPGLVAFFGWLGLLALIWMTTREAFQ
ncbi:MAG: hypothetical protein H8E37_13855 [Planctomycetes bacterium]|nr:hypothetical protein [Planctomycetota bacterium]